MDSGSHFIRGMGTMTYCMITCFVRSTVALVECLTRDRGVAGLSHTGVTVLCP